MPRRTTAFLLLTLAACSRDTRAVDTAAVARDTVAATDGVTADTPADSGCVAAPVTDSAAGPVRLGMRAEEIARRCAGARDSSGTQEGMPTRTLVVPLGADTVAARIVDG